MKSNYPNKQDLSAYLSGMFAAATVTALDTAVGLDTIVQAGIGSFEKEVGRKMLADSVDSTRVYNPPLNSHTLFIDDAVSVTSVVYQPAGSTAQTLGSGTDYWLEPANCAAKREPYTSIIFRQTWWGPIPMELRHSLQVTGKFGYWKELPADVFLAMLIGGHELLLGGLSHLQSNGLLRWKEGDVEQQYGANPLAYLHDLWTAQAARPRAQYQRWSL